MNVDNDKTQALANLQSLEQRRSRLIEEFDAVELSIAYARAEYARLTNQSASIARLPYEVLAHIFMMGAQDYVKDGVLRASRAPGFEVLVSHVTSHWRDVAVHSPSLWTYVYNSSWKEWDGEVDRISVYLERSMACPIDITFFLSDDLYTESGGDKLLSMINEHIVRWRRVFLQLFHRNNMATLVSSIRHAFAPSLEHFSLCHCKEPRYPDQTHNYDPRVFTGGAPSLTFLRLSGNAVMDSQPPLSALTTLHLEANVDLDISIPYPHFCELITAAPSLLNLSLDGVLVLSFPPYGSHTLKIPALRSLRVRVIATTLHELFSAIEAPQLESLVIADCCEDDYDIQTTSGFQFLQFPSSTPKFPILHSLTLSDCHLLFASCRALFLNLPSVAHLTLLGSFDIDILKELEGVMFSSDLPWTQLHTLTIECLDTLQESLLCTRVLTGRLQRGHPVAMLRLENQLRSKFKRRGRLECLERVVAVEKWSGAEPWPPGLDFVDENDVFM